jgi:hypothetical protein
MYLRQTNLLKKMDIKLDRQIRKLENNTVNQDLKNILKHMDDIKKIQIDIQSKLEIYRNTQTLIIASFVTFFDILNKVFRLDKHYLFVSEKLKACDNISQLLYNQIHNEYMKNIQVIVIVLGVISTLILLFNENELNNYRKVFLIFFVVIYWVILEKNLNVFASLINKIRSLLIN